MKPIAVVLSGCGSLDGSEVQVSVLTLLSLARSGIPYECLALDEPQTTVYNHITGEVMDETRSMLVEAARIVRGEIRSLEETHADQYSALMFVGGLGNAINYSDFLEHKANCIVHPKLLAWAKPFARDLKPMGFMGVSSALISAICGKGVKQTLGMTSDMSYAIEAMGGVHVECESGDIVVDIKRQVVSTPLYMNNASSIAEVALGVESLVSRIARMTTHMHLGVS